VGESAGEGAARTAPGSQIEPEAICESNADQLELPSALFDTFALEIDRAPYKHLDYICRQFWAAHAARKLTDGEAQSLAELARDRQRARPPSFFRPPSPPVPRRRPRSPDRQRSLERRRRLSAAGMMPPGLALKFTVGERAVLYVIATEVQRRGRCDLYLDKIAAFAGVGRSTAKNAIREAKRLRLLTVEPWKQAPDWNGPNRIRIVDQAWLAWLAHGPKGNDSQKSDYDRQTSILSSHGFPRGEAAKRLSEEGNRRGRAASQAGVGAARPWASNLKEQNTGVATDLEISQ
jgi:hypothetical protein